jgi:FkbM family methyltransferase
MGASQERLAQFLLRFGSPLAGLRQVPVLGPWVSWAGRKLVPRDALTWVRVQSGAAQGLWLRLNPRTGKTYFEGGGETEVQAVLQSHLRAGMVFYDVGANIGLFSMIAARLVGTHGRVVSFEADPEIAARLREHVARNEFSWASVEETAVWSEATTVCFARTDPETSPDRGLGRVVGNAGADTIKVNAMSLDEFALTHPVPDFIKCDVEGAEVEVFRGAQQLLKQKRPGIVCEMHSEENRRILIKEFETLRYTCTRCDSNHVLALAQ